MAEVGRELLVCGWDEVFVLRLWADGSDEARRAWSWRAAECPGLPDHVRPAFGSTDECKPLDDGRSVLITSSGGGVALVERASGEARFWAGVANAHSADLLPGGRLAVAASHDPEGRGDRIVLFDLARPDEELHSVPLLWAHGAVWDDERGVLWALGNTELRALRPAAWESDAPRLEPAATFALSEPGGHDLLAVPGTRALSVTTAEHCWLFDRDSGRMLPHPLLADAAHVKCISVDAARGRLVYVQAEGDDWWAERLHFLHPDAAVRLPGERLYKARWLPAGA